MSLFVDLLAFPPGEAQEMAKIGIFMGSITSGLCGYVVLRYFTKHPDKVPPVLGEHKNFE